MKNSILIIFYFISLTLACKAQQPLSKIKEGKIKIDNSIYTIIKPDKKYVQLKNSKNKFENIESITPNLPIGFRYTDYVKLDKKLITKICADAIPIATLEKLPMGMNDDLYIRFKMNEIGYPVDVSFLMKDNSLITANQLAQIEQELKNGNIKAIFYKDVQKFFKGANYFELNMWIPYSEMLKAKEDD